MLPAIWWIVERVIKARGKEKVRWSFYETNSEMRAKPLRLKKFPLSVEKSFLNAAESRRSIERKHHKLSLSSVIQFIHIRMLCLCLPSSAFDQWSRREWGMGKSLLLPLPGAEQYFTKKRERDVKRWTRKQSRNTSQYNVIIFIKKQKPFAMFSPLSVVVGAKHLNME